MTTHEAMAAIRAELVRQVRNGAMSERQLARAAGLSQPHVHHLLSGAKPLMPHTSDRLCRALAVDAGAVLLDALETEAASRAA